MAYLRELKQKCRSCKIKEAVVELVNHRNSSNGAFCRRCGKRELEHLKRIEKAERE